MNIDMKRKIYFKKMMALQMLLGIGLVFGAEAQNQFIIQNGSSAALFSTFQDALDNAVNGDTLYLPGGPISGDYSIDKEVHIVGAGYDPNFTTATQKTNFSGKLTLVTGASNSSITGIEVVNIYFGTNASNQTISNITISRSYITSLLSLSYNGSAENTAGDYLIKECILNNVQGGYTNNVTISNSIIRDRVYYFDKSTTVFQNNIFHYYYSANPSGSFRVLQSISNTLFANNIFMSYTGWIPFSGVNNSLFSNNIFYPSSSIMDLVASNNDGFGNYFSENNTSTFVAVSGTGFSFTYDYHLLPGSVGINGGTDGTDIGIYGGNYPWKDGGLPFNPHIDNENISILLDSAGLLHVEVQVTAQDN